MCDTQKMLDDMCRDISDDLDAIMDGTYINDNGYPDPYELEDEEHYSWTLYDYFYDCYDMEITHRYGTNIVVGTSICVALGGPNIYVRTDAFGNTKVEGYWGSDYSICWCNFKDLASEIEDLFDLGE